MNTNSSASLTTQWQGALMDNYGTPPVGLVSGSGSRVVDEQGRELIDMLAGIAVNVLGHAHPAVIEAATTQLQTLGHVSNLFASEPAIAVAAALKARVGDDSARVVFANSGAEANEAAFKLARLTGRRRILAAFHGFHGRTMGSLAMTGQPSKQKPFAPLPSGVEFYTYGDIDFLRTLVEQDPADTAAIIMEPIQGETGVIPAEPEFLRQVRALCDEYGILMIVDEVQTGVGRTGTFFCFEQAGIVPDVITMAKGLGAGLPIGACIATGPAVELFTPGAHGTTFGGNPVVCAVSRAVLGIIDDEFLAQVRAKGERIRAALAGSSHIMQIRGAGLMLGVVVDKPVAKEIVAKGLEAGIIVNAPAADVIRLTPPLNIPDTDIDEACERLLALIEEVA